MEAEGPTGAPMEAPAWQAQDASVTDNKDAFSMQEDAGQEGGYTESGVLQMIQRLHSASDQGKEPYVADADNYLTGFQRDPSAWGICINILNSYCNSQQEEQLSPQLSTPRHDTRTEVLHFAAQTLAAQARAGFPQQLLAVLPEHENSVLSAAGPGVGGQAPLSAAYAALRDGLLHLVFAFRFGPKPVLRQLCVALSSALIFGSCSGEDGAFGGGGPFLAPVLQALGDVAGAEGFLPLLELLAILPEELCAKRIALQEDQRLYCLSHCISDSTASVLQLLENIHLCAQLARDEATSWERPRWQSISNAAVRALQSWLAVTYSWVQLQEAEHDGSGAGARGFERSVAALRFVLQETSNGQLFSATLKDLTSNDLNTLQVASECIVTAIAAASMVDDATGRIASSRAWAHAISAPPLLQPLKSSSSSSAQAGPTRETVSLSMIGPIVKAYGDCCADVLRHKSLPGGLASLDVEWLQAFAQGLIELAKVQIPRLLADIAEADARLEGGEGSSSERAEVAAASALQPSIESICELSRVLIQHPSFQIKELAVSFFRCLLNHLVVFVEEERRLGAWRERLRIEAEGAWGRTAEHMRDGPDPAALEALRDVEERYDRNLDDLALREPTLSRLFAPFAEAAVMQLQPHLRELVRDELELETWQNFRAELVNSVTEAAVLLDLEAPCKACAMQLLQLLEDPQTAVFSDSWAEVEARLFFVSTVANRTRVTVSPPATNADGVEGSGAAAADSLGENDTFLQQVLQLVSQLPLPSQSHQAAEGSTASAALLEKDVVFLFLHAAAARTIGWLSPRVVPEHQDLFAPLFALLASRSLQFIASLPEAPNDSNVAALRLTAEGLVVEGLSSLVASASAFIPSPGREEDVHTLLNALIGAFSRPQLSLDATAALVQTAGYVISCLDGPRIRALFSQLLQSLADDVERCFLDPGCQRNTVKRSLALFFSALHAVQPAEDYCPPPISQSFEPLSPSSGYRHPVLDAVEPFWPTIEKAMKQPPRTEFLYEASCYALVALCGNCRSHVSRYHLFYAFLRALAATFAESPTVYHLGALRSLTGIFCNSQEQCVRQAVAAALEGCVGTILRKIEVEGEKFLYDQPDLVGISFDCVNVALIHPLSASLLLSSDWFEVLVIAVIQFTPSCHHPKVLHTNMVFLSRLAGWVNPPSLVHCYQVGEPVPWLAGAAEEASRAVMSLLGRPFPRQGAFSSEGEEPQTFLSQLVAALLLALTSVHAAPQAWVGNAAQTLLPLLKHPTLQLPMKKAIEAGVKAIDIRVMDEERKRQFCWNCTDRLSVQEMSSFLQQTADDTKAAYLRNTFALGGPSRPPRQTVPRVC